MVLPDLPPETNGATNGARRATRAWPNTIQAASRTGFGRRKLERLAERGALYCEQSTDGVLRWDPDLLALLGKEADEEDDSPTPALQEAQSVALLKQAHSHLEGTLRMVLEPAGQMLRQALEENASLRAHIRKLEESHFAAVQAREELLSEQHLRQLATLEVTQAAARKDKALALAASNLPKMLAALNPKGSAVLALMASLTEEQRAMLLETELLTDEQKHHVRAALAESNPTPKEPEK